MYKPVHDDLNSILCALICNYIGLRTDSEPEGLFDTLIQTDLKRPDAVVKIQKDALTMETVALDISVTSTTSVSGEGRVTHKGSVGKAAQDKFGEKMTKYHTLWAERGVRCTICTNCHGNLWIHSPNFEAIFGRTSFDW